MAREDDEELDDDLEVDQIEVDAEEDQTEGDDEAQEGDVSTDDGVSGDGEESEGEAPKEEFILAGDKPKAKDPEEHLPAPKWVKELREVNKAMAKELRELKAKQVADVQPELKSKPRPQLKDFDYDDEKFATAVVEWSEGERKVKAKQEEATREQEEAKNAYQKRLELYASEKTKMNREDFDDAEHAVLGKLNPNQISAIIDTADRPGVVMYILGTHPKKLDELASIKNVGRFIAAVTKMEVKEVSIKTTEKAKPGPERGVQSSGVPSAGRVDKRMEKLEAEADRTGDRSPVIAYRRQLREREAQKR